MYGFHLEIYKMVKYIGQLHQLTETGQIKESGGPLTTCV